MHSSQKSSRTQLVLGNWKMHGNLHDNRQLLQALLETLNNDSVHKASLVGGSVRSAVMVPFPYLASVQEQLKGSPIGWGAQDVSAHAKGAYTGEVSVAMLQDFACQYVLVGHSERRQFHAETNEAVAQKALQAANAGLIPVVCFGETKQERESGQYSAVILKQLDAVIQAAEGLLNKMVFAYEPVWAIGTGLTASPEQAQEIHAMARQRLAQVGAQEVSILYGGSVKPENASALFSMQDIDGGLIGGAALDAQAFAAIINAAHYARSH